MPAQNHTEIEVREGQNTENIDHINNVECLVKVGRYNDAYIYVINNMDSMKNGKLQNEIWVKIGNYKFDENEYEQALKMYNNMSNYDHDRYSDKIFLNIAYCYQQISQPQQALTYYYKSLEINATDEYCINNIAVLEYYFNQNYTNALKMYDQMDPKDISNNKLYFNVAICYFHEKQYENALNYFYKHLNSETLQNRSECLISMAWIYTNERKNYNKALEMYNKLDFSVIYERNLEFDIAYNYQQMKQYKPALKYYMLYVKKNPNDMSTLHNIAWIYIEIMNDFDAAKPYLIKILLVNKKDFYANCAYGVYMRDTVKNYQLSLQCFNIALNIQPNNPEVINHINITTKCTSNNVNN